MLVSLVSTMMTKFIIILLSFWLGTTALIDFAVIPAVFSTIQDFFNAGELGVVLFKKYNFIELILAIFLSLMILKAKKKLPLILILLCFIIVLIYFFYLTPHLTQLSGWWKEADSKKMIGIHGIKDIQLEHQSFHRLYVTLDTIKIIILSFLMGLITFDRKDAIE